MLRVDEVNRNMGRYIVEQTGCRIDIERRTYDEEDIRLLTIVDGSLYHRYSLAKPDDERTELGTIASLIAYLDLKLLGLQFLKLFRIVGLETRSDLGQLTMQMNHLRTSGTFM